MEPLFDLYNLLVKKLRLVFPFLKPGIDSIQERVEHFESNYDPDLARILVRTRLRAKKYEVESERKWLEEKLSDLEEKCGLKSTDRSA